jgi:hypothetical protein
MARWSDEEVAGFRQFEAAIQSYTQGAEALQEMVQRGETLQTADTTAVNSQFRQALVTAARVPVASLDRAHVGLRNTFRRDFQAGLQLLVDGLEKRDGSLVETGMARCDHFAVWLRSHADEINANQLK